MSAIAAPSASHTSIISALDPQGPTVLTTSTRPFLTTTSAAGAPAAVAATAVASSSSTYGGNVNTVPGYEDFLGLYATLSASLGALLVGLLFAAITYGVVSTKVISYFRGSFRKTAAAKALIAGLVLLNTVQMGITSAAVYTSVVVDFGEVSALLNNNWTITVQIMLTTFVATIAQSFFVYRLHHARRSLTLTITAVIIIFVQLVIATYTTAQIFKDAYVNVMLLQSLDVWAMVMTFVMSGGINLVLVVCGYIWLQKPYDFRKNGRVTLIGDVEYWTFKSLFICCLLSVYNAIAVGIYRLNLSWLAVTFSLGNLYTLSVILNLTESHRSSMSTGNMVNANRGPASEADSIRPPSTATLTNDDALWGDIVKSQKIMALQQSTAMVIEKRPEHADTSVLGYHAENSVV